jgi:hypothetical protein
MYAFTVAPREKQHRQFLETEESWCQCVVVVENNIPSSISECDTESKPSCTSAVAAGERGRGLRGGASLEAGANSDANSGQP